MKLLLLFAIGSLANASILISPVVIGLGPYTYSYAITNEGDDPIFDITFSASGLISDLASPDGWVAGTLPLGNDTSITWVSTDSAFDIIDGSMLTGFEVTSSAGPGSVVFDFLTESFSSDSSDTTGPVTVGPVTSTPEPDSLWMSGAATCALFVLRWRHRHNGWIPKGDVPRKTV